MSQKKGLMKMLGVMRNVSINITISSMMGLFAVILLFVAGLGLIASRSASDTIDYMNIVNIQQLNNIMQADSDLKGSRVMLASAARYVNEDRAMLAERDLEQAANTMDSAEARFAIFMAAEKTAAGEALEESVSNSFNAVMELVREQHSVLVDGFPEDYGFIEAELAPLTDEFNTDMRAFVEHAESGINDSIAGYERELVQYGGIGTVLVILAVVILALVYLTMRLVILRPMNAAVEELGKIADADLSQQIQDQGKNEIGQLFLAMQRMQTRLAEIVADVRGGSDSIYNGAQEIASGNADLSSRTEQQASSLQETATSMEQLTATVKQNADNAQQASSLANEASGTATKGGEVVQEVIVTMKEISTSSQKIADITGLIDSIAFQTNILALNASVEAARAGEQGRGFAVVAGEVRNLAGRSADAAKDIKELIDESVKQVLQGSNLVEQAGSTMQEVVTAVKRVTDIMDEISAASQEQSGGIEQVSQAVSQMDEVTQQNASLVQEAASAAASLEDQAQHLEKLVSVFRLVEGAGIRQQARTSDESARRTVGSGGSVAPVRSQQPAPLAARRGKEPAVDNEDEWVEF